tara:strand:+ start:445 stop:2175 length:1731 start_codon:yes stop_codon:yes gene_type:complete
MAKSVNASGRMSVGRFEEEFEKAFGVRCNVKLSKWRNADNKATLASIRPKDFNAPKKVNLPIVGNMTVRTLKERFEANFGVMIELYVGRKIAPDNVTIGAIREGRVDLSKNKKVKKVEEEVMSTKTSDNSNELVSLSDEQIKEFKDQENEAEDAYDYKYLAEEIGEAGDLKWAESLLDISFEKCQDSSDYVEVSEVALKLNLSNDFIIKSYKKSEELASDFDDYFKIAESILPQEMYDEKRLGDKEWGRELAKKADACKDMTNHCNELAKLVYNELDDIKWATELLQAGEDIDSDLYAYKDLAVAVLEITDDNDWTFRLFDKAINLAEGFDDYIYTASTIFDNYYNTDKYNDSVKDKINNLFVEAYNSAEEFNNFKDICQKYIDYPDYKNSGVIAEDLFNDSLEKAIELSPNADEYYKEDFINLLDENGFKDEASKVREQSSLGMVIGITHPIDLNGDTVFKCSFDIDHNYYEDETGDTAPDRFWFDYDFDKGELISYDNEGADLNYLKIPHEDEDGFESCWYLSSGENFIDMQGESINSVDGDHSSRLEEVVDTLDQYEFKKLCLLVLQKVKEGV